MSDLSAIRSRVEALGMGFQFVKPIQTGGNGIQRETWLLKYQGSHFVFVEGQKGVTLGWDTERCPLGDGVLEGLKKDFAEGHEYFYGQEEPDDDEENPDYESWEGYFAQWDRHLSGCVSPLRTADIGDMVVEVDSRLLERDAPSLEEAVKALKAEGPFTLATEDEWEYLCNGGARTLFRWGDRLADLLPDIFRVGSALGDGAGEESVLNRPNPLGLLIAYDSYQCEIVDSAAFVKGGDGGRSLCGGDGAIYVLPCYTAFYRYPVDNSHPRLQRNYYCWRRVLRLP